MNDINNINMVIIMALPLSYPIYISTSTIMTMMILMMILDDDTDDDIYIEV